MINYKNRLDTGVNNIGYTIVRLAPIIAPVPALATLLDATNYALYAWFVVFGVELTGYAIGEQLVRAIRLNVLTLRISSIPLIIYGLVIEGLMLGYKVVPAWAGYNMGSVDLSHAIQASVGVLYPFFTLAGAILFAFHEHLETVQADENYAKQVDRNQDASAIDFDKAKRQIELDAYRAKLEQDAEIEREKALTELRIKEQKAAAKVSKTVGESFATPVNGDRNNSRKVSDESVGKLIVRYLIDNPGAKYDDIGEAVGCSVPTVSKEISTLIDTDVLHAEKVGRRKVVTVNGNHEAFLRGEI